MVNVCYSFGDVPLYVCGGNEPVFLFSLENSILGLFLSLLYNSISYQHT
jgi:hypothetical protein